MPVAISAFRDRLHGTPWTGMKLGLERLLHLENKISGRGLARAVASAALPFIAAFTTDIAKAEELVEGSVTYTCGGTSFGINFIKGASPGPEDDIVWPDFPLLPGQNFMKATTYVNGIEIMGQQLPAEKEPQNGSCSFVMVFGPGEYDFPGGTFTNSASADGFGGWEWDSPSEEIVIPPQKIIGPYELGIGNSLSISFSKKGIPPPPPPPPIDPNNWPPGNGTNMPINTLTLKHVVDGFTPAETGSWTFTWAKNATVGYDKDLGTLTKP